MTPAQLSAAVDALKIAGEKVAAALALLQAAPPVEPPAEPPAEPPSAAPALVIEPLNLGKVVCFETWHREGRYQRFQQIDRWVGETARVTIRRFDFTRGGASVPLAGSAYTLLLNGQVIASVAVAPGSKSAMFQVPLASVWAGWHRLQIGGLADGETAPTWFALRVVPGMAPPTAMPVCTNSYDITHESLAVHAWAMVPARYTPKARPLPAREYAPVKAGDALAADLLVPGESAQINRPARTKEGALCTFNSQAYHWEDAIRKNPYVHLMDGPRGVGAISMVTHISVGQGRREDRPDSPLMGNVYACTPWSVVRIDETGRIDTLVGARHAPLPGYWLDPAQHEQVGDWSAIPADRQGFRELWGLAWAAESLRVDASASPIQSEGGRVPHATRPTMVVTDTQNNRLAQVTFDPRAHGVPPVVTELATMADPWDVVDWRGSWIVSERGADRVVQVGRDGTVQRVIIEMDPALPGKATTSTSTRTAFLTAGTLADARLQPIMRPEGLYVLGDWLYIGSLVQQQVVRVHLETLERQVVCQPRVDGNGRYLKIAVSDGSFYEAGTLFVQQWSNNWVAQAVCYRPDGSQMLLPTASDWHHGGYGAAVAVGHGRLYVASSAEGIVCIRKRTSDDRPLKGSQYRRGKAEYDKAALRLIHGPLGFGHWGWEMPAGSADMQAFVEAH